MGDRVMNNFEWTQESDLILSIDGRKTHFIIQTDHEYHVNRVFGDVKEFGKSTAKYVGYHTREEEAKKLAMSDFTSGHWENSYKEFLTSCVIED